MSRTLKLEIRGRTQLVCNLAVFDLDDTLIATRQLAFRKIRLMAKALRLVKPKWDVFSQAYKEVPYPGYIEHILQTGRPLAEVERIYNQMHQQAGGYSLLPCVKELLQSLHNAKIPIGILSNAVAAKVPQKIELIDHLITDIWCCGEDIPAKPHPDCLLPIFRRYPDICQEDIVFIGDSTNDFMTVKDTRISFIGVHTGIHNRAEFEGAGVRKERIVTDLSELKVLKLY